MASITTSQPAVAPLPAPVHAPAPVRIEPPHGWLDLRLAEVWEYRELLYFFVWRDIKIRYKQTVIGVLWVVLQPLLTMGVFTLWPACEVAFRRVALSGFLFCGAGAVGVFRHVTEHVYKRAGWQSARHH
jgi:hypothetical protein